MRQSLPQKALTAEASLAAARVGHSERPVSIKQKVPVVLSLPVSSHHYHTLMIKQSNLRVPETERPIQVLLDQVGAIQSSAEIDEVLLLSKELILVGTFLVQLSVPGIERINARSGANLIKASFGEETRPLGGVTKLQKAGIAVYGC